MHNYSLQAEVGDVGEYGNFSQRFFGRLIDSYFQEEQGRFQTFFFPLSFYFLLYTQEESIGYEKIFDIRFSMDLHVLRCPEHDLTIFLENVCLSVWVQNFVDTVSQELMRGN